MVIKSRRIIWAGYAAYMGDAYTILVKRHMGVIRRWDYNIKMNLKETGYEGMDWIHRFQDRNQSWAFVNMVMNLHVT
jgi:hypothetical protein